MMEINGPYSLPVKTCSLRDYTRLAKRLDELDPLEFQRFILTGVDVHGKAQVFVDPALNRIGSDSDDTLSVARDYDSVIGISNDILVQNAISVYPVPNPAEVLSTSIHLNYPVVSVLIWIMSFTIS